MKNLDVIVKGHLDTLYNLRGKDSVILKSIDDDKALAFDNKVSAEEQISELTVKINNLNEEQVLLDTEGNSLINSLKSINKNSFDGVLEKLSINFNPTQILDQLNASLPAALDKNKTETDEAKNNLSSLEISLNDAITLIEELSLRKDEAIVDQDKLNEYIELALAGNINITRDSLTSLLSKFNLNEEQVKELAKLLMFPEDGLFQYNEMFKNNRNIGKSFSDVFAEAKKVETPTFVEKIVVPKVEDVVVPRVAENKDEVVDLTEMENKAKDPVVIPIMENKDVATEISGSAVDIKLPEAPGLTTNIELEKTNPVIEKMTVKELLDVLGFNQSDFTNSDVLFLEENFNDICMKKNVKLINDMGINNDIFVDNIELFIDDELEAKLKLLIEVGKVPFDIYLNPNILVKYDASELKTSIDTLKDSGLDPKKVPLMAY